MQQSEQLRVAGVATFPCWAKFDPVKGKWDKAPAVPEGTHWATAAGWRYDDTRLRWGSGWFGVPVPPMVLIIDVDAYKGATLAAIEAHLGCKLPWDRALIQHTPSGGQHYAFYCDFDARQGDSLDGIEGFDTRAAGRGFICSGGAYRGVGFGVFALAYPQNLPRIPPEARAVLERYVRPAGTSELPQGDRSVDQIVEALRHIDPGCSRSEWVRVGLALRHQFHDSDEDGEAIFDAWSRGDFWHGGCPANYVAEDMPTQWGSFKPEGGTTVATLFYKALQGGWSPPASFDAAGAFGGAAAPSDAFNELVQQVRAQGADVSAVPGIVESIRAAGCNSLQVALLAAELKTELAQGGIKDKAVTGHIDALLRTHTPDRPPETLPGETPQPGRALDPNTPVHPTAWARHQTKGKDMKPKGTLRNFEIMLDAYGVTIQFDEIRKNLRMSGPTMPGAGVLHEEAALGYLESLANLNDYPVAATRSMIMPVANRHTVNPVREWVEGVQWDGLDHVGALWSQITLEPGEDAAFCELMFRKWLRGAYAIGTGMIDRWEFVVVLIDPSGGAGKTRFFATFCPPEIQTDSIVLDTANKDSVKMAVSYWLTELGELDGTFSKSDSAKLKAFLALRRDEMRLPYGRAYLDYPRRTAFWASVNEVHYLIDPSDNRRYWGMRVAAVNYRHTVDVRQAWAQVAAELAQGQIGHLTPQEEQVLRSRNEAFRVGSPIADILSTLRLTAGAPDDHHTVSEILAAAGKGNPTKADINEAARWLRRAGWVEGRRHGRRGFTVKVEPFTAEAFAPRGVK